MSDRSSDVPATGRGLSRGFALALLAGAAGCSSAPQYPIHMGERGGDGTVMAVQPRYAVSAQDAAQNAADRRAQAGYPDYGAAPVADPAAPPADAAAAEPGADAAASAAPADDMADDAPRAPIQGGGTVDSSDLPPPGAAPSPSQASSPSPYIDQSAPPPDAADVPPADPAASPHEIAYAYGGARLIFGTDRVVAPQPELAAYRHRRHAARSAPAADTSSDTANTTGDATPAAATGDESTGSAKSRRRHRHGAATAAADDTAAPPAKAAADTPYQTVVKSGESLKDVAERAHTTREALIQLNDLKHPRHVRAGTVLKIPYRYSYDVQQGDTLYTIAHRFNQNPEQIAKLNGLKAAPTLQPGQSIQLPPDASDQGKRDHASAAGPEPEAAPTKLADAALRKIERRSRHSRAAQLNDAEASLPPQELRHGRRGETYAAATETSAAGDTNPARTVQAPAETTGAGRTEAAQTAEAPAVRAPRPYTPPARTYAAASPASVAGTETPPVRATATASIPQASGAYPPATTRTYAAAATTPPTYGARQTAEAAPAYRAPTPAPAYRATAPAPSTYVAPGYAARAAATPGATQYANLTPPRYTPGYPATGATGTPYTPSLGRERPAAPALSGGAATAADIAAAGRGRFIWPLRGPVVSGFGAKGTGEYNNGVDISAAPGTSVRAAASGDVVYAGSSIPGYGNMVLIKHPGGWVTAYAHLNRIEVRMHDTVSQGDEIGQAGQTGVADRPELYFEVRYAASAADRPRPVDPALVLPASGG